MLWLGFNEIYVMMAYIYCFIPGLISLCFHLCRFGVRSCVRGMTIGEKLLSFLFLWVMVNNAITLYSGVSVEFVFVRVATICVYMYVVRTVVLYSEKNNKLFVLSACVATFFVLLTFVYQYGILGQPIGVRAFGIEGYRVGALGVEEFANLVSPIFAALYYGVYSAILWVSLLHGSYKSKCKNFL